MDPIQANVIILGTVLNSGETVFHNSKVAFKLISYHPHFFSFLSPSSIKKIKHHEDRNMVSIRLDRHIERMPYDEEIEINLNDESIMFKRSWPNTNDFIEKEVHPRFLRIFKNTQNWLIRNIS
jgi:hypothetical protein